MLMLMMVRTISSSNDDDNGNNDDSTGGCHHCRLNILQSINNKSLECDEGGTDLLAADDVKIN